MYWSSDLYMFIVSAVCLLLSAIFQARVALRKYVSYMIANDYPNSLQQTENWVIVWISGSTAVSAPV